MMEDIERRPYLILVPATLNDNELDLLGSRVPHNLRNEVVLK
jgi:hypothetical protein